MGCSVVLQLKGGGWGLESNCHRKRVLALSEYSYGFKALSPQNGIFASTTMAVYFIIVPSDGLIIISGPSIL
jgi:hypothetical protein